MKIKIISLSLLNFQGIKKETFQFSDRTDILGDNGSGKTTIGNAFSWLMFGKNLEDQQNFEIKTLDENNVAIPKLQHEVEALLLVDETEQLTLKRVLKEKWVKKRGDAQAMFQGNTEDFFVNDVPFSKADYQSNINGLVHEQMFKLITNPHYFNNTIDWKKRREMLFKMLLKMSGAVSFAEVAQGNKEFMAILTEVESKSIYGFLQQLLARRKKLNEILKQIPSRIDEVSRSIPEMTQNKGVIEGMILTLENELKGISGDLESINAACKQKAEDLRELNNQLQKLEGRKSTIITNASKEAYAATQEQDKEQYRLNDELSAVLRKKRNLTEKQEDLSEQISKLTNLRAALKEKWEGIKPTLFDSSGIQTICPTCNQNLPETEIEVTLQQMQDRFNSNKVDQFYDIKAESMKHKERLSLIEKENEELTEQIRELILDEEKLKADLETEKTKTREKITADRILSGDITYANLISEIETQKTAIESFVKGGTVSEEEETKATRQQEILDLLKQYNAELSKEAVIKEKQARVIELEKESDDYAQQIADIEKLEYTAEQFNKAYISGIESKINGMFEGGVQWRLFKQLVNGGSEEDCTLLYNGVPWNDISNAQKIQTGLNCIKTFSRHYGFYAPIIVDNAESIVKLPEIDAQLIRLVVSEIDKKLRIINN